MNNKNKIEQTANMILNLHLDDFIAVENIINRIIISKKENKNGVQHETKEQ